MLRSIVALFSLLFLISFCTAKTAIVDGIEWTYTVSNGTAIIGTGTYRSPVIPGSTIGTLIIPSTLGGYPVTEIGCYAFYDCTGLTSVTIPSSVTFIRSEAFYRCRSLTSITIPEGVTEIGDYAFYGCSGLTSIAIPEGVTEIGDYAFYGCSKLTSVIIPNGVTKISDYVFSKCSSLVSITIPEGVTEIGDYAFEKCSKLTSATIPKGVTYIGSSAFSGCSGLTGNLVIPENVTSIGGDAFGGCSGLTGNLVIPKGVTYIGMNAFSGCSGLTGDLVIPAGIATIYHNTFSYCKGLSGTLIIPKSVKKIENGAFNQTSFQMIICLGPPPLDWEYAGILKTAIVSFPQEYSKQWEKILFSSQRGTLLDTISTADVTVSTEMTTPKTMSVTYTIHSEVKPAAKVYALAFEDGERSFAKVVPIRTATEDSPEPVPNGNEVATNTAHTFIWNVPADWDTDLSKVMVEILVQEGELLPLELITIPGDATTPDMTITRNVLPQSELFNALLWCYASGDATLKNENGVVTVNGIQIARNKLIPTDSSWSIIGGDSWKTNATALLNYLYGKMGYKVLSGANLSYAEEMTELDFSSSGFTQVAVKVATSSVSEE